MQVSIGVKIFHKICLLVLLLISFIWTAYKLSKKLFYLKLNFIFKIYAFAYLGLHILHFLFEGVNISKFMIANEWLWIMLLIFN